MDALEQRGEGRGCPIIILLSDALKVPHPFERTGNGKEPTHRQDREAACVSGRQQSIVVTVAAIIIIVMVVVVTVTVIITIITVSRNNYSTSIIVVVSPVVTVVMVVVMVMFVILRNASARVFFSEGLLIDSF